eukprot:gene32033-16561_t
MATSSSNPHAQSAQDKSQEGSTTSPKNMKTMVSNATTPTKDQTQREEVGAKCPPTKEGMARKSGPQVETEGGGNKGKKAKGEDPPFGECNLFGRGQGSQLGRLLTVRMENVEHTFMAYDTCPPETDTGYLPRVEFAEDNQRQCESDLPRTAPCPMRVSFARMSAHDAVTFREELYLQTIRSVQKALKNGPNTTLTSQIPTESTPPLGTLLPPTTNSKPIDILSMGRPKKNEPVT